MDYLEKHHKNGRLAWATVPGTLVGLPSREKDSTLRPHGLRGQSGRRGVLDAMMLHPRIGTGFRNLRQEVSRQHVVWTPSDGESQEQIQFTDLLMSMVEGNRIVTDATDVGSSWRDIMSWVVDEWAFGFALANWSWRTNERGELVLEVFPVMPSTIERWVPDADKSTWTAVRQLTELKRATIPRDQLIYVRTRGAPGEWEGESILRPQLFGFESWKESSRAIVMIMAAASGLVHVKAPESGSSDPDWDATEEQMVQFEQGLRRWFMTPAGYDIDMSFPASGATGGLVEILRYWDSQIDYGLAQSMQSLGFSANGSRALGEELGEESQELRRAALETLLGRLGYSIASVVAARVGYDGPLPQMEPVVERRRQIASRVQVLRDAVAGGLVRWTPEREAELADELDLSVADVVEEEAKGLMVGQLNAAVEIARSMFPADGSAPLDPEVARELFISAGLTRESADRIITAAKRQALPPTPPPVEASAPRCGCGTCSTVRLAAKQTVSGADGVEFEYHRELTLAERSVAWGEVNRIHLDAQSDLERGIATAAMEHRSALWEALQGQEVQVPRAALDAVQSAARERYALAIQGYAIRLAGEVAQQAEAERHRQIQPDGSRAYVIPSTRTVDEIVEGRVQALIERAADTIASRVWGEVEEFWAGGGTADEFTSRQTQLHREAEPVGNAIEAKGRFIEAVHSAPDEGIVPVEAIRTAIRDESLCDHCAQQDGTRYDLLDPSGLQAMMDLDLPDPQCEGGTRYCRCGLVLRYERLVGEDLERYIEVTGGIIG